MDMALTNTTKKSGLTSTAEYRAQLDTALENLTSEEGWARWLKFRSTQHNYSWANTILALCQFPTATLLRGYGAKDGSTGWLAVGRQVKKGEKAIRIFAPVLVNSKTEVDAVGKPKKICVGFKTVSVFDVSQSDGEELPAMMVETLEGEAPLGLREGLEAIAASEGLTVTVEAMPGAASGFLDIIGRRIVIDEAMSLAAQCKTLAHELGHWFDPDLASRDNEAMMAYALHRADAEAVAESVAYIIGSAHGMSTDTYSLGYIATWVGGDVKRVKDLAARVDKAAQTILKGLAVEVEAVEVEAVA